MHAELPLPPESLRICVGPFADADSFVQSGIEAVAEIVSLCGIPPNARVLDVGCGCGRLARVFANYLGAGSSYEGLDIAPQLLAWCKANLEPKLSGFHFSLADGPDDAQSYSFPFDDGYFDLAVASSVFTHMLPAEIENYVAEIRRVLKSQGRCFATVFLFDDAARDAVRRRTTIFDFRHRIGPCLAFDAERPREGIACDRDWFLDLLQGNGFALELVRNGNWRKLRSYEISQDTVVARKR